MHEILHAILDPWEAPVEGDDHSYGTVTGGKTSPMLTGYTELYAKNASPPGECNGADIPETNWHTTTLSDCTREEVTRYLAEHLAGSD